jgi:hypothetical protein
MLIDDEGYVKPASRESRLVMIQLEPRAEKETKRKPKAQGKSGNKSKSKRQRMQMDLFLYPSHGSMLRLGRASWQLMRMI